MVEMDNTEKRVFIGIDHSKKSFDAVILDTTQSDGKAPHRKFSNDATGFESFYKWVFKHTDRPTSEWLLCAEETAPYHSLFADYVLQKNLFIWYPPAVDIAKGSGMRREKSDKSDALMIAEYAKRFKDRAIIYTPVKGNIAHIKSLLTLRQQLIDTIKKLEVPAIEQDEAICDEITGDIRKRVEGVVDSMREELKRTEDDIMAIIRKDSELKELYCLLTSIVGIGPINAIAFIVFTNGFKRINTPKQLCSYAGVAPFRRESGTSVRQGNHVSHYANKYLKSLLYAAAMSAIHHDPFLKAYYQRLKDSGKPSLIALNNVKNKLITIMCAVVRDRKMYQRGHQFIQAKRAA